MRWDYVAEFVSWPDSVTVRCFQLIYRMPVDEVKERQLQVTVWSYDALKENEFLGAVIIDLSQTNLTRTTTQWHQLHMHR